MMNRKLGWLFASGLLVLIMGLPVVSQSTEPEASFEDMIKNAKTKADHETLASHYELQAKALTGKAEEHRRMGKAYGATPFTHKSTTTFAQHCNNIAYEYEEAAKQHKALADLHRQLAAEAAP